MYSINQSIKGYEVTLFTADGDEYSFTTSSWNEVVKYFAEFGIIPNKPKAEEKITPNLTYNPFKDILGGVIV